MSLLPTQNININPFDDVTKLLQTNKAFINPLEIHISTGLLSINNLKSTVQSSLDSGVVLHSTSIIASIDGLIATYNRLLIHSDSLTGKSLSGGLNGANLATIASVVENVQKYRNDGVICSAVYSAFGVILNAIKIAEGIATLIGQAQNLLSIPDQIASNIDTLKALIEEQIESDLIAFANAQLESLQMASAAAITSLIGNECIGQIFTQIATQEMKTIIDTKIREKL